jgi:hypothetical protein
MIDVCCHAFSSPLQWTFVILMPELHQCQCQPCCQGLPHPEQALHQQINLLMARLDEQQRRWLAAIEANRLGHGGEERIAEITGLDPKTIRRGRQELADSLNSRPVDRVRLEGAGRPLAEKKIQP